MKKLLILIVLVSGSLLSASSFAQTNKFIDSYPTPEQLGNTPTIIWTTDPSDVITNLDRGMLQSPLKWNCDPGILLTPKLWNCDPGILLPAIRNDLDPGIIVNPYK